MVAMTRRVRLTAAESFWYALGCVWFGAMYLAKVPAKKALSEAGLTEMTSAERFWYVLQCAWFGSGYLAKLPVKKALSEVRPAPEPAYQEDRYYYDQRSERRPSLEQVPGQRPAEGYYRESPPARQRSRHARHDDRSGPAW